MKPKREWYYSLHRLVRRERVVDLEALCEVLRTRSRMTVFRRLRKVGYLSSFSHGGRFYTLADVPAFDELGLWFHEGVGFSRLGTLKETVARQVEDAPDGRTHAELQHVLRVRVHNTLHGLLGENRIGRERWRDVSLYVSREQGRAATQVERRREVEQVLEEALRVLTTEETVEVLVEALRAAPEIPTHTEVAERLAARGIRVGSRLVLQVYERYGMEAGKKTSRSRSSRR
jgi:hypothetical protein